jgi:hypothetical protein
MKKEASNSISVIPTRLIEDSLHRGVSINELAIKNNFISYLNKTLGLDYSNEFVAKYFIGTSDHWSGATIFWQVDISGKIRAGKVILYDETTGKRIKSPFNHIHWIHRINNIENFEMRQCFFGEHLLKDETRPVAIVESEKTAVIASSYIPEFIWLAAGSRDGLNEEKCKVLSGRSVVLFPDLNCLEHWENKAEELSHFANFFVSDFLELMASKEHKELGLDLADYLVTNRPDDFKAKKKNTSKNGFCVTFPYEADIHQQQNFKQVKTQIQAEKMDIVYSAKSIPADTTDNGNLHISVGEDIANLLPEEQVKSSITKIINN